MLRYPASALRKVSAPKHRQLTGQLLVRHGCLKSQLRPGIEMFLNILGKFMCVVVLHDFDMEERNSSSFEDFVHKGISLDSVFPIVRRVIEL